MVTLLSIAIPTNAIAFEKWVCLMSECFGFSCLMATRGNNNIISLLYKYELGNTFADVELC